jgi:DNA-binding PadR family transcriptional regulator
MLRQNWFHILVALARGDMHGSAIADDVLGQTDGDLRLWPATLYRTLDDLVAGGLIEELAGSDHPEGESRRKRYYRVTGEGRRALAAAARQLSEFADEARERLDGASA